MKLLKVIAKTVALPIRIVDLPLKVIRKVVGEEEPSALEKLADYAEESIEELQ